MTQTARPFDKQDTKDMLRWLELCRFPTEAAYTVEPVVPMKWNPTRFVARCPNPNSPDPSRPLVEIFGKTPEEALAGAIEAVRDLMFHNLQSWIEGLASQLPARANDRALDLNAHLTPPMPIYKETP